MLEDQVAYLLQRYLGNYVRGLNKEALKISVWQGDVELTNMQLKPEALNALKLPVKVKAGFLGSVKLKVPWSRLGQDPVLVYLDRIFLLAEPATQVEGCTEDAVQEVKKSRIRELEMKLLERRQLQNTEMNKSWLGSLINTIIGNLKLSISNIHIRYEDLESNPGHPFAAGLTLEKLAAVTVDDDGRETFVTGGSLERIQKSVELQELAVYMDSDVDPWHLDRPWEDMLPFEWDQVFRYGTGNGKPADGLMKKHAYILQPVTGNAKYLKERPNEITSGGQPLQKAVVNLDDVTLCLSKTGYRDLLKLADNFGSFNQRLKYAHYRPLVSVKSNPRSWWKYAYRAVSDQLRKASGKLSWEQVLRYASLRRKYISLYASLLKSDLNRTVIDDNKDIEELDRELDIDLIIQWRMLAHKFVEKSMESDTYLRKQKSKKSWWSFGWSSQSNEDENEPGNFTEEDWERLNKVIGYKDDDQEQLLRTDEKGDILHTALEIHMKHNASKLNDAQECLAELSSENLDCLIKLYAEAKVFDVRLGSYQLTSPSGLLAKSASAYNSLVGVFCYKPFDANVDWSLVAKASPCYVTYRKDSINQIINFFQNNAAVSQIIALETAAAVQMTLDEVKRTAQQQVNRALKDHSRFSLDLDIAAPKITIPTDFCPDKTHSTKLLLDLGNLMIHTQDHLECGSPNETDMYFEFDVVLSDVSAFLVDGDYDWGQPSLHKSAQFSQRRVVSFLPVIDKCGVVLKFQQIRLENPSYPSTRVAVRVPSLGFHFSPGRYHRLMQVMKIFEGDSSDDTNLRPWDEADFEGWLRVLTWKGVGSREAVWQQRYLCLVGPFLYVLESPGSRSYKQYTSLRGKQLYQVPPEIVDNADHVLAIHDAKRSISKVIEDVNVLILRCDSDDSLKTWKNRLQGAIYSASGYAPITGLSETSSDSEDSGTEMGGNVDSMDLSKVENVFMTGVLDEFKLYFSYGSQHDQTFVKVLLAEESCLFEIRAIGGQVELSLRSNDMFIGMVLKALEVEDLVCCKGSSQPCYLARSFIQNTDELSSLDFNETLDQNDNDMDQNEGEEFYEAPENLNDPIGSPTQSLGKAPEDMGSQSSLSSEKSILKPPSFIRVAGLLPKVVSQYDSDNIEVADSFVKAQLVLFDQNSSLYSNIDKQVVVTLSTLSFFCRRPTILAIMDFINAINIEDGSSESFSDNSSTAIVQHDISRDGDSNQLSSMVEEPVVKGLLGRGKSRVIFHLKLDMARAQIMLMKENGTKLATLSQDNFLTDIKVFPSSFGIKASLGNLKISDDSLDTSHKYYWACDMRNPGGSSFVELEFCSFSADDDDYDGYEYRLLGQLSEIQIVYLNRFIQEIIGYFMGLVPQNSKAVVKVKDQVTNSEKWLTTSQLEGSPALKLDLSLRKPIIVMPRRTDSDDYLKLDIVHITVRNSFQWVYGNKTDFNAVHMEMMTVLVEDINLNVGSGTELGESIINEVKGVSIAIQRSLRDLLHQIPSTDVTIKVGELKAALSNKEYQIITECVLSNISETPNIAPPLNDDLMTNSVDATESQVLPNSDVATSETQNMETWVDTRVSVVIDLVELSLHYGAVRDAALATVQVSGVWLLYKSNTHGVGYLSATLKGLTVIDDREGTEDELRLAIRKPDSIGYGTSQFLTDGEENCLREMKSAENGGTTAVPTMLFLDATFSQYSTSFSLCIQRPQLLVALDFLLAVVEFFVPTVRNMLSGEEDDSVTHTIDAIILDQSVYLQPLMEFSLSPRRPLVVDDERYDFYIYDGRGGTLFLQDRQGLNLSSPSAQAMIYVGSGKKLQFKNVVIKNGQYLDSCIFLGSNSSYSASENDKVYLSVWNEDSSLNYLEGPTSRVSSQNVASDRSTEFIIELQAIGPELTFYHTSKAAKESVVSNKLLHAQLDAFCRLILKGNTTEMCANALGVTVESNGIRILEPFDVSVKFSNASGKTNIQLAISDVFMNFSFSTLRLFLAVEEDILAFLRRTSKKMTMLCSEFNKIGKIENPNSDQIYAFWRPRAPPGFAVLGDYLTPIDKPPTKGVLVVNTSFVRVRRPKSFKLIWPVGDNVEIASGFLHEGDQSCSIWLPEAPKGYVAMGCVVSPGRTQPPLSSVFCILASLVSPCSLRDCITIDCSPLHACLAFWRVDNSVGTFLPADPTTLGLNHRAYELRHIFFKYPETSLKALKNTDNQVLTAGHDPALQSERLSTVNSEPRFEAVASFRLIWWNQGSSSRKKLSIWRPIVPQGMVYFGDVAVQGYEPPNTCIVLHDSEDDELFKDPLDFQLVGQIKKHRGIDSISFWLPQAPPGFVSLGCIASKGSPKQSDLGSLRCMRSDMVTGDQFLEQSIWDASDDKFIKQPFSIWTVGNELGTFTVRSGFKKPPRRFALKLADQNATSGSDDIVINAEVKTLSAALFDDYGGLVFLLSLNRKISKQLVDFYNCVSGSKLHENFLCIESFSRLSIPHSEHVRDLKKTFWILWEYETYQMVPLCNISLSGIGFSLNGRSGFMNSSVSFSLAARSFNDKYEAWEPVIEPVDSLLRYQYNLNAPGAASQLRLTSTRDLNVNVSVANANMLLQAYASWSNFSHVEGSFLEREAISPTYGETPIINVHHKRNYYIIPQNKLGQDIFIRATEVRGLQNIIKMPSGDMKPLRVPVSKNMLDSHMKGNLRKEPRVMVAIIISEAEFPKVECLSSHQYTLAVHLTPVQDLPEGSLLVQRSARTCGASSESSLSSDLVLVNWNEIFFFKVESLEYYMVELILIDIGKGDPIGYFSASLKQLAEAEDNSYGFNYIAALKWLDLISPEHMRTARTNNSHSYGRIKCAVLMSPRSEVDQSEQSLNGGTKTGFIQISPSKEGPWTTVRLNYAAPAACWRLGNDVVASEVTVKDGNRYVTIRSLVSFCNSTDFSLDLCLKFRASNSHLERLDDLGKEIQTAGNSLETEEVFETETYDPVIGWVEHDLDQSNSRGSHQETFGIKLPPDWQWVDDWHVDTTSVNTVDGWVYAPDFQSLKWPESHNPLKFVNYARQRRWIRNKKKVAGAVKSELVMGPVRPGESVPLPLVCLSQSGMYILQLRPSNLDKADAYSWSSLMDWSSQSESVGGSKIDSEICVSTLRESEELLYCSEIGGTSSNSSHGVWFCLTIQALEIAKDVHSDPIQDWSLVVKSPLSITNYLPLAAEYSVFEMQASGHFLACARGLFSPGETVRVYNADIRNPLCFSLLPQRGWLPIQEAVLISHPSRDPSKTISLRSSFSGRVVQVILEQNLNKERPVLAKAIRIYSPYWFAIARCPPLTFKIVDLSGRLKSRKRAFLGKSKKETEAILEEITDEEIFEGHTIASALNFKLLGLSASITQSGEEHFGPIKDLSPLGDMDGSLDLCAYDADGNCMHLFLSSKPCPYQSVPTKVISVRPFMTLTNRVGQDMFVKLSDKDEPKLLRASDARVFFLYRETGGLTKLQVRFGDTGWSFPVQIIKEDTIVLVLRKNDGTRMFLKTEIRGYEEGSRYIIVFRLQSPDGPIRFENRTSNRRIRIRQFGSSDDAWLQLEPLSTTNFSWEDPYGQRLIENEVHYGSSITVCRLNLDKLGLSPMDGGELGLLSFVTQMGDNRVARFVEESTSYSGSQDTSMSLTHIANIQDSHMQSEGQGHDLAAPLELIVELGVFGVSIVDHRPKELAYLYLERVFISYLTGYDGGTTSRFKLIVGYLQADNQLPLTAMPVLMAPEQTIDINHPVFKMTVTKCNENPDGIQVYPYIYIRVTDKCWRINIHEPIIWAFVDFYSHLQLDRISHSSSVTQVDPEIRIDLIDVSEVRLKLSLETAPAQRPHGVLGVWSPILSAIGNAFKIQVHLRKVMHRDRFMRRSAVIPAITKRIWRDLVHNPLHLIFSIDVLGMTSSTLASLSKGFAELSTDGQFLQLRSKQVWSRRITGIGDGIVQGTEALAQGVAFGVSGVVTKPVESARQSGLIGLAHGLGRAFVGFFAQPVSGALDFFSLTVDGIGASCSRCLEFLNGKTTVQRIRNPRVIHADNVLREYCEREATGQMILYLAEASRHFGCTEIFKEPSKFAWSDYYEDHFFVPYQRIALVTNKRVVLLQCLSPEKLDNKPCKIMWDVPWDELMALELAKAGHSTPCHVILHLTDFRRSEAFVRVIKCNVEEEPNGREPQAVRICSLLRKMWKTHHSDLKSLTLKVPSSQRHVCFAWNEAVGRDLSDQNKAVIKLRGQPSSNSVSDDRRFIKRTINFTKVWSSEQELKSRCTLRHRQASEDGGLCSIWRPICPDGYVSIGDIAHVGGHPPNVAAVYQNSDKLFTLPVGYDLVWRNCLDDYNTPVSIWHPRAPAGYVSPGCVVVPGFTEPDTNIVYCVAESIAEETVFEEQKIWSAPDSYPWACHVYQVRSDALHFVALRQPKEESDWKPRRVLDNPQNLVQLSEAQ